MQWAENFKSWIAGYLNVIEHTFKFTSCRDCIPHGYLLGQEQCTQEHLHTAQFLLQEPLSPKSFPSQSTCVQKGSLTLTGGFQLSSWTHLRAILSFVPRGKGNSALGGGTAASCWWDSSQMSQLVKTTVYKFKGCSCKAI